MTTLAEARLHEGLSQRDVVKPINRCPAWYCQVERGKIKISPTVESQLLELIRRLGMIRRETAIAERQLAVDIVIPPRLPSTRVVERAT